MDKGIIVLVLFVAFFGYRLYKQIFRKQVGARGGSFTQEEYPKIFRLFLIVNAVMVVGSIVLIIHLATQ